LTGGIPLRTSGSAIRSLSNTLDGTPPSRALFQSHGTLNPHLLLFFFKIRSGPSDMALVTIEPTDADIRIANAIASPIDGTEP
jgi:hypothetical protein